jgi:hypothetical protein
LRIYRLYIDINWAKRAGIRHNGAWALSAVFAGGFMRFLLTFAVVAVVVTLALSLYPVFRGSGGDAELRTEREDRGFRLPRDFVYNLAAGVISGVVAGFITKRL